MRKIITTGTQSEVKERDKWHLKDKKKRHPREKVQTNGFKSEQQLVRYGLSWL